ncbi:MAG: single-stranded DNA-binding protein [Candidatus Daviesbacteria bacterium]|nr:single-stranded DNA-binding protein [Candidatus Daviesbacteria bacterium]
MSSRSWNRVELIGNLTRDPELRYTPNGAAVCTFGLATNRTFVTDGERKEEVDFHRLVAWNKLAELCNQLLKKGTKVFISGRLQTRSWEGNDGQTRQTTEIVVEDMIVLTPRSNGDMETPPPPKEEEAVTVKEEKVEEKEVLKDEPKKPKETVAVAEEVSEDLPF